MEKLASRIESVEQQKRRPENRSNQTQRVLNKQIEKLEQQFDALCAAQDSEQAQQQPEEDFEETGTAPPTTRGLGRGGYRGGPRAAAPRRMKTQYEAKAAAERRVAAEKKAAEEKIAAEKLADEIIQRAEAKMAAAEAKAKEAEAIGPAIDEWKAIKMGSNKLDGECGEVFTLVAAAGGDSHTIRKEDLVRAHKGDFKIFSSMDLDGDGDVTLLEWMKFIRATVAKKKAKGQTWLKSLLTTLRTNVRTAPDGAGH